MKTVSFSRDAARDLRKYRKDADRLLGKINRYAENGMGDVTELVGSAAKRLRVGNFRIVFVETEALITITRIAPRGSVYE